MDTAHAYKPRIYVQYMYSICNVVVVVDVYCSGCRRVCSAVGVVICVL